LALADARVAGIALADLDEKGLADTANIIEQKETKALFRKVDVTDSAVLTAFFAESESTLGGLDIIHNNAGTICGEPVWPASSLEKINLVVSANLLGVMYGTRIAMDVLQRRGRGVIINTASTASLAPMPADPIYSGTKTAVVNLVQASAGLAISHNIRVNAILPGIVNTQFIGRTGDGLKPAEWLDPALAQTIMLTPEQIAEDILTLISNDDRASERLIVDKPIAEGEAPQITRLKDPVKFYSFIAERAQAMAAMQS
jgi:NADP-dependent 3-hydroxy acid dehydrogenase YdfG